MLVASTPGSPDLELLPRRGTTFDVKNQSGLTIEFQRDASGKVVEAAFNDNGTAFVMKKK
jgi:YD repeat-containing protein